jgi:hypothetical protein
MVRRVSHGSYDMCEEAVEEEDEEDLESVEDDFGVEGVVCIHEEDAMDRKVSDDDLILAATFKLISTEENARSGDQFANEIRRLTTMDNSSDRSSWAKEEIREEDDQMPSGGSMIHGGCTADAPCRTSLLSAWCGSNGGNDTPSSPVYSESGKSFLVRLQEFSEMYENAASDVESRDAVKTMVSGALLRGMISALEEETCQAQAAKDSEILQLRRCVEEKDATIENLESTLEQKVCMSFSSLSSQVHRCQ